MLRNPDRHVEIVARHRGKYDLFHLEDSSGLLSLFEDLRPPHFYEFGLRGN
jgi:hypothetical protein